MLACDDAFGLSSGKIVFSEHGMTELIDDIATIEQHPPLSVASASQARVAILGASGYSGAELLRLLLHHPNVAIRALGAERQAGKPIDVVFPHLRGADVPDLQRNDEIDWDEIDVAICALPHGLVQEIALALPKHLRIIDVSADFRLRDAEQYQASYGKPHQAMDLQRDAVYGLSEWNRDKIRHARLVACPGCYPTSVLLPLLALLRDELIQPDDVIVDAASGTSGAGRDAKQRGMLSEAMGKLAPYGVATHRHVPEIEQELFSVMPGQATLGLTFTPHLASMVRGILSTIHVRPCKGVDAAVIREKLVACYREEPFIRVLPEGAFPDTGYVLGSNFCDIAVFGARNPGRVIVFSAIDNLVKGASGQAVQNLNIMMGWPEQTGLRQVPFFP